MEEFESYELEQHPNEIYRPYFVQMAYELALLGHTDKEMCRVFQVATTTLNKWKHKYPEFEEAIHNGKDKADAKVAMALYKKATGYEYEEEQINVSKGAVIRSTITKHVPPDAWSCIKWLQARQKATWTDTQKLEITSTMLNINKLDFTGFTDEELLLIRKLQVNHETKELSANAGGN
jgi:hypothetical protein